VSWRQAPSAQRVAALQSEASAVGWAAVAPQLRQPRSHYERQGARRSLVYLFGGDLFGQTGSEAGEAAGLTPFG